MNQQTDRFGKAKIVARSSLKKFGPLIFTGLAAVAEHHWLKRDDDPEPAQRPKEEVERKDDSSSIKELKQEVKKLRKKIRKGKRKFREDSSSSSSSSSVECVREQVESLVRGRGRRRRGEEQTRVRVEETHVRPRGEEQVRINIQETHVRDSETAHLPPPPAVPDPPERYARFQTFQPPQHPRETSMIAQAPSSRSIHIPPFPPPTTPRSPRPRRHRHHSLPPHLLSPEEIHASKVAAVAGLIEALHLSPYHGDWIGRKGVRVGTVMAAAFGGSVSRDKRVKDIRVMEELIDVGKGLAVGRLVFGNAERVEGRRRIEGNESRGKRRVRRWSSKF